MGKLNWTSIPSQGRPRRRRRARLKKKAAGKKFLLVGVLFFLLFMVSVSFDLESRLPGGAVEITLPVDNSLYWWESVLRHQMTGIETTTSPGYCFSSMARQIFRQLLGLDLQDPASILALELSGWSVYHSPVQGEPDPELPEGIPPSAFSSEEENGDKAGDDREQKRELPSPGDIAEEQEKKLLVYHSHITESFVPDAGEPFTEDLELTVAHLGEKLVKKIEEEYGIPAIHHKEIFDQPRRYAYSNARPVLQEIMEDYPDIGMVVDLHRDGVTRNMTTAEIDGENMGKTLLVVGSQHERWRENYQFARDFKDELENLEPEISRGIKKQPFTYNQDLHPCSFLLEVGGHENSLEEAERALPVVAEALSVTYRNIFHEEP